MKTKTPARDELENLGSLITIKGTNICLGPLMQFSGNGVFDATYGKVDVSAEEADAHNKAYDEASLKGLDESCQIGQGGTFYYNDKDRTVKTFNGTVVSIFVRRSGTTITFGRKGKIFRGRVQKEADCFNFRRIS